jgi:hypothetical protein
MAFAGPLDVHLGQGRNQRLFRPLVPLENLGGKMFLPILGNPQLELSHPGHQTPAVVARAITLSPGTSFSFFSPDGLGHLLLQDLLEHFPHQLFEAVFVSAKNLLKIDPAALTLVSGHGIASVCSDWVILVDTPICHDLLSISSLFAEPSVHYLYHAQRCIAKKVQVRVACPPLMYPYNFGISTRTYDELLERRYLSRGDIGSLYQVHDL